MGLLDNTDDPTLALGMGLLSASGPSRMPVSLGQAVAQGYGQFRQARQQDQQLQMQQLQMTAMMRRQYMIDSAMAQQNGQPPPKPESYGLPSMGAQTPVAQTPATQGLPPMNQSAGAPASLTPQTVPTPQPTPPAQAAPSAFNPRLNDLYAMTGDPGLMKAAELAQARNLAGQTDLTKTLDAAGITDPGLRAQILQANLAKTNYVAPVNARPGAIIRDPMNPAKVLAFNPHIPEGGTPQFDQGGNVTGIRPLPGAADVMGQVSRAQAGGQAQYKLQQVWDPSANNGAGGYINQSVANVADAANGPTANNLGNIRPNEASTGFRTFDTPQAGLAALDQNLQSYGKQGVNTLSGIINKWAPYKDETGKVINDTPAYIADASKRLGLDPNQKIDLSNPAVRQAVGTAIMLHEKGPSTIFGQQSAPMASQPPLPAQNAATNAQTELSKQWADQQAQNSQAQNIKSYLQMIKDQAAIADKAPFPAIGPGSGWGDVANGVASTVLPNSLGMTKRATNAVTANDLMAKAANQIIGRLSAGDMGTDAGKAINTLATPGAHMNLKAINDAADNLSAAQDMVQARTKVLAPFGNSRNQQGYQQTAQVFDQNADPTLLQTVSQYKSLMPGSPQAKAFLQKAVQSDPTFASRMQALARIGAF